jgi:uncharacterized protein (TIGR02453 family)
MDFPGFPAEATHFYCELSSNNNRDWFYANKARYEQVVLEPAQSFVISFGERLRLVSNAIRYDPRTNGVGSIMRIYRDLRFSKDKTPYKTHLGIVFWEGSRKKTECPGFYFQMESDGANLYSGIYNFPKGLLMAYREAVVDHQLGTELETSLQNIRKAEGFRIDGIKSKRVPAGYDREHPRKELLCYSGLWAESPLIGPDRLSRADLIDLCFDYAIEMLPLHKWLVMLDRLASN